MTEQVEIKIKSPTYPMAADLTLFHSQHDTVHKLKYGIQLALNNANLTPAAQKLIYAGHVLQDEKTLLELNLTAGSSATIHLVTGASVHPVSSPVAAVEQAPAVSQHVGSTPASETSTSIPAAMTQSTPVGRNVPESSTAPSGMSRPSSAQSIDSSDMAEHLKSIIGDQSYVRTGLQYQVYMIDGLPYLIQQSATATTAASRHTSRSLRSRAARATSLLNTVMGASAPGAPTAASSGAPNHVRHQAVELPSSSAIPVVMADGRQAVMLSPEGIRAMTQQGVVVPTQNAQGQLIPGVAPAAARHPLDRPEFRAFMRTGIPHAWLFLKLVFLVMMLGSHASWKKFLMLNAIAVVIFLWQSGLAAGLFRAQARPVPVDARPVQRNAPVVPGTDAAAAAAAMPAQSPTTNDTPNQTIPRAQAQGNALQNLAHAFVTSILPSTLLPDALPAINQEANAAQEGRDADVNRLGNDW
ncbi:hypothetical protein BCR37DRAFT_385675 [Protomyces lactucae-debilis]|uniref:Ubiquitin-like domain-containing protein n=1 Tax=Protomyces lactucae-debilis TaxID=2754530 RepID=A0A1Y2FSB9_PROLT|nr:uncharacterized protein BCR37DRAFT_385675 [Protomyces lactucae-debilis]ORY86194.1 hypothetical protein BCR37DRAFT_385675 [Protomyces lactucae-debilis]